MPMFKKSGGKIFAVQFNKAEERALDQEIKKQIVENDRAFDMDKESSILWMLHTQFGFGPKRLKLAWKLFYAETLKLREYYLMEQADDGWLARKKLKDIGCDIEEWYREEGVVKNIRDGIRILGNGELTKKLTVQAMGFSKSAEEKIVAAGGKIEVI